MCSLNTAKQLFCLFLLKFSQSIFFLFRIVNVKLNNFISLIKPFDIAVSSELGSGIMLTPGQAGPIRETETK